MENRSVNEWRERRIFFVRWRLLPWHNRKENVYRSREDVPDFIDLCPFILASSQSAQDAINNYSSVIVTPHYSDREAQEFLLRAITRELSKAPLTSEKIKFDRSNNIGKRIV